MKGTLTRIHRIIRLRGLQAFLREGAKAATKRLVVPHLYPYVKEHALTEADLAEICEIDGTHFSCYDASEEYTLDLPTTPHGYSGDDLEEMKARYGSPITIDAPYVAELFGVDLVGPQAVPIKNRGFVFENTLESYDQLALGCIGAVGDGVLTRGPFFRRSRRVTEPLVSLVGPWTHNYTHWFQDYLARLEGLEHYERETDTETKVLIPANASTWMLDALRALGYGSDRCIEWQGGRLRVDRFVVPAVRRESRDRAYNRRLVYSPTGFRWIRDRVTSNIEPQSTRPHSPRIYISREDATVRRVENETTVMDLLSRWGFERYRLAELSYAEQVTLFSDAEAIVSPHGSGLLNQIYADNAAIIELFGPKHSITDPAIEYYLADLLGHDYGCVQGEAVGCDTRVDIEGLEILLKRMLT